MNVGKLPVSDYPSNMVKKFNKVQFLWSEKMAVGKLPVSDHPSSIFFLYVALFL